MEGTREVRAGEYARLTTGSDRGACRVVRARAGDRSIDPAVPVSIERRWRDDPAGPTDCVAPRIAVSPVRPADAVPTALRASGRVPAAARWHRARSRPWSAVRWGRRHRR